MINKMRGILTFKNVLSFIFFILPAILFLYCKKVYDNSSPGLDNKLLNSYTQNAVNIAVEYSNSLALVVIALLSGIYGYILSVKEKYKIEMWQLLILVGGSLSLIFSYICNRLFLSNCIEMFSQAKTVDLYSPFINHWQNWQIIFLFLGFLLSGIVLFTFRIKVKEGFKMKAFKVITTLALFIFILLLSGSSQILKGETLKTKNNLLEQAGVKIRKIENKEGITFAADTRTALIDKYLKDAEESDYFWKDLSMTIKEILSSNPDLKVITVGYLESVLSRKWGLLILESNPSGGNVKLKNSNTPCEGTTPLKKKYPVGRYTFELIINQSEPIEINVFISEDKDTKILVELKSIQSR